MQTGYVNNVENYVWNVENLLVMFPVIISYEFPYISLIFFIISSTISFVFVSFAIFFSTSCIV